MHRHDITARVFKQNLKSLMNLITHHSVFGDGTRLFKNKIMGNILEAAILSGEFQDEVVLLPWIPMNRLDSPILFKRLQFPIRLAFAMTINKSQGKTMRICDLDLENPCFPHGYLYVACSVLENHRICLCILLKD